MEVAQKTRIMSGLDVLVQENFARLQGARVAILANQASVDSQLRHIVSLAIRNKVQLVKLFAPEHGFSNTQQDMEFVGQTIHASLKIPVISLYGDHKESLKLRAHDLEDVDILLCDLQDIGSRYYTFHCTIAWALAACAQSKTHLLVVDRPNPINGSAIEGNRVKETHFSFVGAYPLLNRHGFTMGEIIDYVVDHLNISLHYDVIEMKHYDRRCYFDELDLPFISPSPNMPTVNTTVVYPGMCLVEGTNLSEGRGTCTPFELIGAPYISDAERFKDLIEAMDFAGVVIRPVRFVPQFQKHAGQECQGVFVHVVDRSQFTPLRFAIGVISAAQLFEGFAWRTEPYEFEHDRLAIDLLLGDTTLRELLEKRASLHEIFACFDQEETQFLKVRDKYLRYPLIKQS